MDEEYSQGGSGGIGPPGSGGLRGVAPPDQHHAERAGPPAPVTDEAPLPEAPLPGAALPPTGDDRVDAAVASLGRLPGTPAGEHVTVLEGAHGRLRDILGALKEGPERPELAEGRPAPERG